MWTHWVIRASTPHEPFIEFRIARRIWTQLALHFPDMLAATLMPNHWHLILPQYSEETTAAKGKILKGILGPISRENQVKGLWQPMPPPVIIPDKFHLRRQLRYVALNPCRKGLCADPLEWYWSTYREVMGATAERPKSADRLAQILGETKKDFTVRFHNYVSADPSVQVTGTPPPKAAIPKKIANKSIEAILYASAAALRVSPTEIHKKSLLRTLFIHMANRYCWHHTKVLADICKVTPRAVLFTLQQAPPPGMEAADLCLGDRRLRAFEDLPKSRSFGPILR